MRIRSLQLDQFRKFDRPVQITGFTDGVNLLCGPNEHGKSTILAAIRGLIFEHYASKADPVQRMRPRRGQTSPWIAMEFELGDGLYRIEKRFLHKNAYARLILPDGSRFDDDAAEEQLQQLLGFAPPRTRGSSVETTGMFGVLWVPQKGSLDQAELADTARSTIQSCLEDNLGALAGGTRGQTLIKSVKEELAQLIDGHGRPKARYKAVKERLDEIARAIPELQNKKLQIAQDMDDLALAQANHRRLSSAEEEASDNRTLEDADRRLQAATQLQARTKQAEAQLTLHKRELELIQADQVTRRILVQSIKDAKAKVSGLEEKTAEACRLANEAADLVQNARLLAARRDESVTEANQAVRALRRKLDLAVRTETLTEIEARLARADAAQRRATELAGKAQAIAVTEKTLQDLRKAVQLRDKASAALKAIATELAFDLEPAALHRVTVNGSPVPSAKSRIDATQETALSIEGVGRITVRPSVRDQNQLVDDLENAEKRLSTMLESAGVADLDEAGRRLSEKQRLEGQAQLARDEVLIHAPGGNGLKPGPEALATRCAELRAQIEDDLEAAGLTKAPPRSDAERELKTAEAALEALATEAAEARAALSAPETLLQERRTLLIKLDAELTSARTEVERLTKDQRSAQETESDEDLELRRQGVADAVDKADAALTELRRQDNGDTVELLEQRIQRYKDKIEQRRKAVSELRAKISGLTQRILLQEGDGIDEKIAQAEREHEQLERERAKFDRDVRVLGLLRDTLAAAEREAKERYMAPVVRRVEPYLKALFPASTIEVDENFRITGVIRSGDAEEFDRLSDGTQEQLSILSRLAFADMLIDRGLPAMVILDDALAYSDGQRMERMFDILSHAGRRTQILILSCRDALFENLGATRLEIESMPASMQPVT